MEQRITFVVALLQQPSSPSLANFCNDMKIIFFKKFFVLFFFFGLVLFGFVFLGYMGFCFLGVLRVFFLNGSFFASPANLK